MLQHVLYNAHVCTYIRICITCRHCRLAVQSLQCLHSTNISSKYTYDDNKYTRVYYYSQAIHEITHFHIISFRTRPFLPHSVSCDTFLNTFWTPTFSSHFTQYHLYRIPYSYIHHHTPSKRLVIAFNTVILLHSRIVLNFMSTATRQSTAAERRHAWSAARIEYCAAEALKRYAHY